MAEMLWQILVRRTSEKIEFGGANCSLTVSTELLSASLVAAAVKLVLVSLVLVVVRKYHRQSATRSHQAGEKKKLFFIFQYN